MRQLWQRLQGQGVGARLARGTLWAMGSAVLVRGLGLLGSMLAARLLGAEAFGQVGVVQQVVAMMGTLAGLGVGTTASRFIAESRTSSTERTGRILGATAVWSWGAALLGCAVLAATAPWLAAGPLASSALTVPLLAALPLLLFSLVGQALVGGLAGFEAFRASAVANLVSGLLGVPLQILGAWWWGVPGFVLGLAAAEAVRWLVGQRALARLMREAGIHWQRPQRAVLRELLGFGLPSMLASMLVGPVLLVSFAVVGRQPGGYAEVGLFQATQQFRNLLIFVAVQSTGAIVPVLAAAHGSGDRAGVARGLRRAVVWAAAGSALLAAGLVVVAPWVMGGFGPTFGAHWSLLWWLALLAPVQAVNTVGIAVLGGINRAWATLCATAGFALGALTIVTWRPDALGLVLSQGGGSVLAMLVIAWALRHDWKAR
ncbi:MAG: hypothetical protein CFE45_00280 [Burkholderiales bacterium PBB5]|nr:MAG: hypothetical protein CFE45_00280 [Burkholderiales bacterium PBB5]